MRTLVKLGVLIALLVIWLVGVAATAQDNAAQIAGVIVVLAPVVLPFVLKYIPAAGHYMVAITAIAAIVIASVAGLLAHLFSFSDLRTLPGILAAGTAVYGLMQFVFTIFEQSPALVKYVK